MFLTRDKTGSPSKKNSTPRFFELSKRHPIRIIIGYLFFVWIITLLVPLPEIIKVAMGSPVFLFIPFLFGRATHLILIKTTQTFNFRQTDFFSAWLLYWLLGSFLLLNLVLICQIANIFFVVKYLPVLTLSLLMFATWIFDPKDWALTSPQTINWYHILYLLLISLIASSIPKLYLPFPFIGRNFVAPMVTVEPVMKGLENGLMIGGYPMSSLHTMLVSGLSHSSPFSFVWLANFLITFIFCFGMYKFLEDLTDNQMLALISVLFAPIVLTASLRLFFDTIVYNFRGNTLLFSIFPWLLYATNKNIICKRRNLRDVIPVVVLWGGLVVFFFFVANLHNVTSSVPDWTRSNILGLVSTSLFFAVIGGYFTFLYKWRYGKELLIASFVIPTTYLMHFQEGLLFCGTLIIFVIVAYVVRLKYARFFIGVLTILLMMVMALLALEVIVIPEITITQILAGSAYENVSINVEDKLVAFRSNSDWLVGIAFIGTLLAVWSGQTANLHIALMYILFTFIYFLPEPLTYRFFKEIVPFMSAVISLPILVIVSFIAKKFPFIRIQRSIAAVGIGVLLVVLTAFPNFHARFADIPDNQEFNSYITRYEYSAMDWIAKNTDENTHIVSDFTTMLVMHTYTNRPSWIHRFMRLAMMPPFEQTKMWFAYAILRQTESAQAYNAICTINDLSLPYLESYYLQKTGRADELASYIVVISSRTASWLRYENIYPVLQPQFGEVSTEDIRVFQDSEYFTLLHSIDNQLYIFGVKPCDQLTS